MATYYIDGAVGSDANAGTSEGSGNAWATIDKAMNTVAAGDRVWVKATGTYVETPTIDTNGSNVSPIIFEGYTSTTGDEGKVTIASGATTNLSATTTSSCYYLFKNFIFSGGSSNAASPAGADYIMWYNCEFVSGGADGAGGTGNNWTFYHCEFLNNTSFGCDNTGNTNGIFAGCIFSGNGSGGVRSAQSVMLFYKNVGFNNGTSAVFDLNACTACIGNTVDGENTASVGIDIDGDAVYPIVIDNIVYDCTTGIGVSGSAWVVSVFMGYNLLNNNTTDYSNTYEMTGVNDVTSAPAFTDEAGDDYTLGATSPAIDAGLTPGGIT
jgi:hypothetical protein